MANNYAEYINANLNWLSNYLNHLADFDKQYRQAVYNLCNGNTDDVEKSSEILEYEEKIKKAYDNATRLYNDLKQIAQKYNSNLSVKCDLESFHRRFTTTRLPIYESATLKLTTTERHYKNGNLTGLAAEVSDNSLNDEEIPVLQGGLQYNHYTEQDNEDYYTEYEVDGDEGYSGDSMELAAEYKRKYEEERKKKAEELAKQNAAAQTTPQQSSANWIMPVNGKITSSYGKRKPPVQGASTFHNGWDIAADIGTPIKAVADGKVITVGSAEGYGYWVAIDHGRINGTRVTSEYGHISSWTVAKGQVVKVGEIIAKSGNTGYSSGPHLHITIREGEKFQGKAVDPSKYIKNLF